MTQAANADTIRFMPNAYDYPKLRPVDARPSHTHAGAYDVTDPSGIAAGRLTLSDAALFIVSLMNGRRRRVNIQAEYLRQRGTLLFSDELDQMIRQLDKAHFLSGPSFDAYIAELTARYRAASFRSIRDRDSLAAPLERIGRYFDELFARHCPSSDGAGGRVPPCGTGVLPVGTQAGSPCHTGSQAGSLGHQIVGLVAPHLDYERGAPCYAPAYADLARRTDALRFVILGTNHFGLAPAVVGTRKDFETAEGVVLHDAAFMRRLHERCGRDLCEFEYDHVREHSIELQVLLLRHVLGDRPFTIAPFLCPDPCGPAGTAAYEGRGVDLKDFANALRAEIEGDDTPTCIVAGADLSHVGRYFQDHRDLDADALHAVEASDRRALDYLLADDPEGLRRCVAESGNATSICSIGCLYVLATVLQGRARPRLLGYHQALTVEAENCVTCAAIEYAVR